MQRLGIDTHAGLQQRRHRDASTTTTSPPTSCAGSATWPQRYGVRLAFEALAWGRYVDDYRRAWRIVEQADHPAVGICLDSFHILSRGHDPAAIEQIPGDKVFFLQLADAPALLDGRAVLEPPPPAVPGRGQLRPRPGSCATCSPPATTGRCRWRSSTTPSGRPTPSGPPRQALRSLRWLGPGDGGRRRGRPDSLPARPRQPAGYRLRRGQGRRRRAGGGAARPARLRVRRPAPQQAGSGCGPQGDARVVVQRAAGRRDEAARWPRSATRSPTPTAGRVRARAACWRRAVHRRTYAGEEELRGGRRSGRHRGLPGGRRAGWDGWSRRVRARRGAATGPGVTSDRPRQPGPALAALRRGGAVLQPRAGAGDPVVDRGRRTRRAGPQPGDAIGDGAGAACRSTCCPSAIRGLPQHIAFACDDLLGLARAAVDRGLRPLPVPGNYYDDLAARFDLDPELLERMRERRRPLRPRRRRRVPAASTRAASAGVFLEVVERRGGYDGYGAPNAPVRLAAQLG